MQRIGSRARPRFAATAVLSAALLTACAGGAVVPGDDDITATGSTGDEAATTPVPPEDPTPSVRAPVTAMTTPSAGTPSPSPAQQPAEPDVCDLTGTEISDTDFGRYAASGRAQVVDDPGTFTFSIADDQFNPCADLSWIVLEGTLGNINGMGGTGASLGEAVVFFHQDQLITEPPPFMMRSVESVQQIEPGTVRVVHGHPGGAAAEGVTETFPTTHTWDGTALASDTSQLPAQERPSRIDVASPPAQPATDGAEVSQTLVAGRYRLPINDNQNLLCDIGHVEGATADCYADFPTTWKVLSTQHPQATRLIFTVDPPYVRGTSDSSPTASRAEVYGPVQGGTTLKVGEATVDLTEPNQATISTPDAGILITPDSYEIIGGREG